MSNDSSTDGEPPRKRKRRSKWGIKPEGSEEEAEPTPPPGPKGAEAAAAKINAMLASQGKLVKSEPPPTKPVLPHTRPQSQITAFSGAGGAPSSSSSGGGGLLSTPLIPPNPSLAAGTGGGSHSGPHYVQDKVFVGMSKAPGDFNIKEKLEGQNGSFLTHIATQTGAKVFLRGQGSGYIEPTSKKESFEALHIYISHSNQKGLESAKKLCESLIQTVQSEFDSFMLQQQPLGYGGGSSDYGPQAPYVNPYQHPYPPPSGAYPPPPGPPYPLMNHHGQQLPPPPPGPYHLPPYGPPPGPGQGPGPLPPPGHPDHYPPPNFPPPHPHPNAGPPHYPPGGYYPPPPGMHPPPPGAYPYPPSSAPMLMEPPAEPAKPNLFTEFKRFDREPPPEKRKFQEAPVPAGISAAEKSEAKESHFSSTHTGSEVSSDGGSAQQDTSEGEAPGPNDNQTESSRQPSGLGGGWTFKETPAPSSRHFEEKPPSLPNSFKKPRSFKELPPANGELGKTGQSSVTGKWEGLQGTSTVLEKTSSNSKTKDLKEVETAAKEASFALPTLRPKDMDDMPAPKLPGRSLLMKRAKAIMEQSKRAGLVAESSEVVLASNVNASPQAKKPEEVIPPASVPASVPATKKTQALSKVVSGPVVHSAADSQPKTKALSLVSYSSEEDSDSDAE